MLGSARIDFSEVTIPRSIDENRGVRRIYGIAQSIIRIPAPPRIMAYLTSRAGVQCPRGPHDLAWYGGQGSANLSRRLPRRIGDW